MSTIKTVFNQRLNYDLYLMVNILSTIFIAFQILFDSVALYQKLKVQSLEQLLYGSVMV